MNQLIPRVLIVDDHQDARKLFGAMVESVGAQVVIASSGKEAIDLMATELGEQRPLKMVMMDIHMPEMNGMSAARTIRGLGYKGVMVAFTAVATGEWRKSSLESGVDAYFNKNVVTPDLIRALLRSTREG